MQGEKKKMSKYVLFGAGIAGSGAINYIGKENIIAVIDNNPGLVGTFFEGVPIISLKEYLDKYLSLQVLISIQTFRYYEAVDQLKENGVWNYFTMPPVLYGFCTPEQIVDKFIIGKCSEIALYGINPITNRILDYIEKNKIKVVVTCLVRNKRDVNIGNFYRGYQVVDFEMINTNITLVITTSSSEDKIREAVKGKKLVKVLDIYRANQNQKEWKHNELKRYKGIHYGKRGFVIGNGPSLLPEDLEKLRNFGEISFAANGIYHIYGDTNWRPNYYTIVDLFAYKDWLKDRKPEKLEISFIPDYYYANVKIVDGVNRFHYFSSLEENELFFSEDIVEGLYSGRTVTYAMLQLACYMGIKEIYLLGVDWTGGKGSGKPRYDFYNKEEILTANFYDSFMDEKKAFIVAKKYAEEHGIKIYNATRGGELEVFDRVDYDSLF